MVLKVRETLVGQRTLLVNPLRGHAAEFGVIAGKGLPQVGPLLTAIEQETTIPPEARDMAALLSRQIEDLDTRLKELDAKLTAAHKANVVSQRLATIPGVGPVTALTLAIEIDPTAFESGRHLAAWAGQPANDGLVAGSTATQATQGRGRGARQQDGTGGMGADGARGTKRRAILRHSAGLADLCAG